MSIDNVRLLRTLIREMVTEAPYRSSQRVTLDGVRFSGTPNMRATLMAGGIVGLINLYDWAGGLCAVDPTDNSFPIKLSKPAAEKIAGSRAQTLPAAEWAAYQATIEVVPTQPDPPSDTARLLTFYASLGPAAAEWPADNPNYDALNTASDTLQTQASVLVALKQILAQYTGCASITLDKMPMKTRSEYIDFLKNIGLNAQNTFETNLTAQRDAMTSQYPGSNRDIVGAVDGIITTARTQWTKQTLPNIK